MCRILCPIKRNTNTVENGIIVVRIVNNPRNIVVFNLRGIISKNPPKRTWGENPPRSNTTILRGLFPITSFYNAVFHSTTFSTLIFVFLNPLYSISFAQSLVLIYYVFFLLKYCMIPWPLLRRVEDLCIWHFVLSSVVRDIVWQYFFEGLKVLISTF